MCNDLTKRHRRTVKLLGIGPEFIFKYQTNHIISTCSRIDPCRFDIYLCTILCMYTVYSIQYTHTNIQYIYTHIYVYIYAYVNTVHLIVISFAFSGLWFMMWRTLFNIERVVSLRCCSYFSFPAADKDTHHATAYAHQTPGVQRSTDWIVYLATTQPLCYPVPLCQQSGFN